VVATVVGATAGAADVDVAPVSVEVPTASVAAVVAAGTGVEAPEVLATSEVLSDEQLAVSIATSPAAQSGIDR
jgi:hypothetical protein